jgi:hypothetical protein
MNEITNQNINPIKAGIILMMGLIVITTLTTAYFSARSLADDKIRVADVQLIGKFLQSYKINEGSYPVAVNALPMAWQEYLQELPKPPNASGNCSDEQNNYRYMPLNGGQDYSLSFCLGSKVGAFTSGPNTVRPAK